MLDLGRRPSADQREAPEGGQSCSVFPSESSEKLAFGLLHGQRRFGIGLQLREMLQLGQSDARAQQPLALRQFPK